MKPKTFLWIRVFILVGICITIFYVLFLFDNSISIEPLPKEKMLLNTIDNLDKRVFYTYTHAEGFGEDFTLAFSKDYKLCFFNSSNPSQTATWNPDIATKYKINQSGFNVWYYRGEGDNTGEGKIISHLEIPTEKNFCSVGGTKIYLVSTSKGVEISPK